MAIKEETRRKRQQVEARRKEHRAIVDSVGADPYADYYINPREGKPWRFVADRQEINTGDGFIAANIVGGGPMELFRFKHGHLLAMTPAILETLKEVRLLLADGLFVEAEGRIEEQLDAVVGAMVQAEQQYENFFGKEGR